MGSERTIEGVTGSLRVSLQAPLSFGGFFFYRVLPAGLRVWTETFSFFLLFSSFFVPRRIVWHRGNSPPFFVCVCVEVRRCFFVFFFFFFFLPCFFFFFRCLQFHIDLKSWRTVSSRIDDSIVPTSGLTGFLLGLFFVKKNDKNKEKSIVEIA